MRVCLLGGNGFIGSHLVDELCTQGHDVTVYDRQDERYRPRRSDVRYIYGELGNAKRLQSEALPGMDVVIHLASSTTPKSSNENPALDVQGNLISTLWMLQACIEERIKRVIFISSGGTVYGIPQRLPLTEDHPTQPLSSYGIVKITIEKYLSLYGRLHGLDYRVLRPANPYGPRQNPLGEQGIVAVYLWRIMHGQPVVVFGDGRTSRDYFYIDDLSRAVSAAIVHQGPSRIFNVGSGQGTSINELITRIEHVLGQTIRVERITARPFDVPQVVLDTARITREMEWTPRVSLDEGLRRTWDWLEWLDQRNNR